MGSLVIRSGLPEVENQIKFIQFAAGAVPSPFDCFLCLRGIRTLAVRMRAHMLNGLIIAHFLDLHPKVMTVMHPGKFAFCKDLFHFQKIHAYNSACNITST